MATILVVEDERSIAEMLAMLLQFEGYTVLSAGNGVAALDVMRTTLPDLILCDVMMPVLDGLGLLDVLVSNGATIPVIMMTAGLDHLDRRDGIAAFLRKPFRIDHLLSTIRAVLRDSRER